MLLSPKDKLSRVVANYPVIEVKGKAGQLASLAWPGYSLLAADMLVVAAEGLVDVEQKGSCRWGSWPAH